MLARGQGKGKGMRSEGQQMGMLRGGQERVAGQDLASRKNRGTGVSAWQTQRSETACSPLEVGPGCVPSACRGRAFAPSLLSLPEAHAWDWS